MLDFIVMQMSKINREKGYCLVKNLICQTQTSNVDQSTRLDSNPTEIAQIFQNQVKNKKGANVKLLRFVLY